MNRLQKIALLTKVIQGDAPAHQLRQASRQLILLMVQKEPGYGYSIKPDATKPKLLAGILTELEYNELLAGLRRKYDPVICMIRPEKKPRPKSEE